MRLICMVVHLILLWFLRKLDFLCTGSFLDSGCDFDAPVVPMMIGSRYYFLAKRKKLYFNTMNRRMSTMSYRPFTVQRVE